MEQLNIPFKLGMDYDNWELDLECLPDRMRGYDSYIYLGKGFNIFLNYPTDKTELIFRWDILEAVIISFNCMEQLTSLDLIKKIIGLNGVPKIIEEHNCVFYEFENTKHTLRLFYIEGDTYMIISNHNIKGSLFLSLLC